jgi:hypothetical protein
MGSGSLFEELKNSRGNFAKEPQPKKRKVSKLDPLQGRPGIMEHTAIMKIMEDTVIARCLSAKDRKAMANHRTKLCDASWKLGQVLGKVNETIWKSILTAQLDHFIKGAQHQQPNGRWQIAEYACEIRADVDGIKRIYLVCKLLDESNQTDLQYRNGVPIQDINVNLQNNQPAMSAELIEAIKGNAGGNQLLAEMLKVMQANARVQAAHAGVDVSDLLPEKGAELPDSDPDSEDHEGEDPEFVPVKPSRKNNKSED